MANRAADWLAQAAHDLQHARNALGTGDYDWACFAAQQSAEKSVKALLMHSGGEGGGHSVTRLLVDLKSELSVPEDVLAASRRLDKHYIPARYPNGFASGTPSEYYTDEDARQAIADAETVHNFCGNSVR